MNDETENITDNPRSYIAWKNEAERLRETLAQKEEEVNQLRDRLQFDPGGSDKIDELESAMDHMRSSLARVEQEREEAVRFANKVERGEVHFAKVIDEQLQKIASLSLGKTIHENLTDAVARVLAENTARKAQVEELANELRAEECMLCNLLGDIAAKRPLNGERMREGLTLRRDSIRAALSTLQPEGAK